MLRATGSVDFVSLAALKSNQAKLHAWVDSHFLTVYSSPTSLIYVLVYSLLSCTTT